VNPLATVFVESSHQCATMASMIPVFPEITVPVDGSQTTERGIAFALELAAGGGHVHFCSVTDDSLAYITEAEGAMVDIGPMLETMKTDAQAFCDDAGGRAEAAGILHDAEVLHGERVTAIETYAHRNGSNAIVIGTHARVGLARALLGSVAEGLLQTSSLPVVVVHDDDETRTGPVAVAIDDSPAAAAGLDVAIHISLARGRSLALVHVLEGDEDARGGGSVDKAAARAAEHGLDASIILVHGSPAEHVLETAEQLEACIIVTGTHGRATIPRFLLGSVAGAIVRHARVPVTTVRR